MQLKQFILTAIFIAPCFVGCKQKPQTAGIDIPVPKRIEHNVTLFDKELNEIKEIILGQWQLISGENGSVYFEFDETFIVFNNDRYVWIEDGETEEGCLNWRREATGNGYDSFFTDVFYEENPTFPLAIVNDTLIIQDISSNLYKYRLVRK